MSRPIQTQPYSFLGLLGLKNTGRNPPESLDTVQPMLDLLQQYLLPGRRMTTVAPGLSQYAIPAGNTAQLLSPGTPQPLIVPQSEVWYVHSTSITLSLGAAAAAVGLFRAQIRHVMSATPGVNRPVGNAVMVQNLAAIAAAVQFSEVNNDQFYMLPGDSLQMAVDASLGMVGAANTLDQRALITSIPF